MNNLLSLDDIDVSGKKVFLRVDLNMPMKDGQIQDVSRLDASIKTLKALKEKSARTLVVTHMGRPKEKESSLSTHVLLPFLKEALDIDVMFAATVDNAKTSLESCNDGDFILLENIRFWKEEEQGDSNFSKELANMCDVYVNEAFSVSHRKHASVYTIPKHMDTRIAGYNLMHEVSYLQQLCHTTDTTPPKFILSLVGGSKVSTKMKLLESLLTMSKLVVLGGGMANTFLVAAGKLKPGNSFYENDFLDDARDLLSRYPLKILLPIDGVVTDSLDNPNTTMALDIVNVPAKYSVVDIGPKTIQMIKDKCSLAHTILWNGPFGVFENPPFHSGSRHIAAILAEATREGTTTIAGGGDTLACLGPLKDDLSFVSTAGGAFLEYLEECTLPGVQILYENYV
ncbi:MAG: phosphoglycerate kinase [Alphaproteobacteria bacterium]|nr:phosphoglycerate kinase [Alphaproteobacteria bacterium]